MLSQKGLFQMSRSGTLFLCVLVGAGGWVAIRHFGSPAIPPRSSSQVVAGPLVAAPLGTPSPHVADAPLGRSAPAASCAPASAQRVKSWPLFPGCSLTQDTQPVLRIHTPDELAQHLHCTGPAPLRFDSVHRDLVLYQRTPPPRAIEIYDDGKTLTIVSLQAPDCPGSRAGGPRMSGMSFLLDKSETRTFVEKTCHLDDACR